METSYSLVAPDISPFISVFCSAMKITSIGRIDSTVIDKRRGQLIENTYQGRPGALWEFTHIPEPDEGTLKRHVIDQAFVAADGTEYAILAAGRAELWDANKDVVFSTALNTFRAS